MMTILLILTSMKLGSFPNIALEPKYNGWGSVFTNFIVKIEQVRFCECGFLYHKPLGLTISHIFIKIFKTLRQIATEFITF